MEDRHDVVRGPRAQDDQPEAIAEGKEAHIPSDGILEEMGFPSAGITQQQALTTGARKREQDEEDPASHDASGSDIREGQVRLGTVTSVTDQGAVVDLGGVAGFLPVKDMFWDRTQSSLEWLPVGDSLAVQVLRIDRETETLTLGLPLIGWILLLGLLRDRKRSLLARTPPHCGARDP